MADSRTYWEKLKDPRWQRKRLEVMERANFSCEGCGSTTETLHVHHGYYERYKEPWDYDIQTLWCLCEDCHATGQAALRDVYWELAHINPRRICPTMIAVLRQEEDEMESFRRGDEARSGAVEDRFQRLFGHRFQ